MTYGMLVKDPLLTSSCLWSGHTVHGRFDICQDMYEFPYVPYSIYYLRPLPTRTWFRKAFTTLTMASSARTLMLTNRWCSWLFNCQAVYVTHPALQFNSNSSSTILIWLRCIHSFNWIVAMLCHTLKRMSFSDWGCTLWVIMGYAEAPMKKA